MNKLDLGIGTLVVMFLGIMVVIAMFPTIANQTTSMTSKNNIVNETINIASARVVTLVNESKSSFTVANEPDGWRITGCPLTSFSALGWNGSTLVLDTDYNVTLSTGVITFKNTNLLNATTNNNTYVTYTYCPESYTTGATASVVNLVLIMAALGLIGFCIFFVARKLGY